MRLVEIEVKYSAAAILTEFKMLSLQSAVVQIDTNLALLTFKVKQFEANKTTIVEFLSGFIDMHQSLKLDLAVIDKLDASSAAQPKTLMAVFVEYFRMLQTYKQTKLRQTTRKFIDEFYLSVMMAVEKHHNLILLAYNLHAYYGGGN